MISVNKNGGNVQVFDVVRNDPDAKDSPSNNTTALRRRIQKPNGAVLKLVQGQLASALRSTFLPTGFPSRTPPGYLRYSIWSWVQDLSTQLRSVLATQRILEGVGVGREGATALSALFNYLVRDGFGMAATLLFTYAASSRFRSDCKRWRIFADLSVDVGITLEVAATLLPSMFFLPMICMGNVFKAMCGVAAGACGGSINLHWAKGSDISDINAKFGAQHTITAALGLVFAGIFAQYVDRVSSRSLWTLYFLLTVLHICANLRCMRLISFDYLNTIRMDMVLERFFFSDEKKSLAIASPQQISQNEPLWFLLPTIRRLAGRTRNRQVLPPDCQIHLGVSFNDFCRKSRSGASSQVQTNGLIDGKSSISVLSADGGYLISSGYSSNRQLVPDIMVCFLKNITPLQEAKAYFHSKLLSYQLAAHIQKDADKDDTQKIDEPTLQNIEDEVEGTLESSWGNFVTLCEKSGWDLSRSELDTRGYEILVEQS